MKKLIACCGLDCETCDARIATVQNNDELRRATAVKWQQMFNSPEIPYESINCTGCRLEGIKFAHCDTCSVRICVENKGYETCGNCPVMDSCDIVSMIHKHAPEALQNLRSQN